VGLTAVLLVCAAQSPSPPLHTHKHGGMLVIAVEGSLGGVYAFGYTMVYLSIRRLLAAQSGHTTKAERAIALHRAQTGYR
jgi:hypothetical protein